MQTLREKVNLGFSDSSRSSSSADKLLKTASFAGPHTRSVGVKEPASFVKY